LDAFCESLGCIEYGEACPTLEPEPDAPICENGFEDSYYGPYGMQYDDELGECACSEEGGWVTNRWGTCACLANYEYWNDEYDYGNNIYD
jgi:hypothetical protein